MTEQPLLMFQKGQLRMRRNEVGCLCFLPQVFEVFSLKFYFFPTLLEFSLA